MQSEEKARGIFEGVAYALVILSALAAFAQFASQPVETHAWAPRATTPIVATTAVVVAEHI